MLDLIVLLYPVLHSLSSSLTHSRRTLPHLTMISEIIFIEKNFPGHTFPACLFPTEWNIIFNFTRLWRLWLNSNASSQTFSSNMDRERGIIISVPAGNVRSFNSILTVNGSVATRWVWLTGNHNRPISLCIVRSHSNRRDWDHPRSRIHLLWLFWLHRLYWGEGCSPLPRSINV